MRGLFAGFCFAAVACACQIPDLPLTYPPLARQARIQGDVSVRVSLDDAAMPTISDEQGHALLRNEIAEKIRVALFPQECGGQTFQLSARWTLADRGSETPTVHVTRPDAHSWIVDSTVPYMIACGEERLRRKFPFSFLKIRVAFCRTPGH